MCCDKGGPYQWRMVRGLGSHFLPAVAWLCRRVGTCPPPTWQAVSVARARKRKAERIWCYPKSPSQRSEELTDCRLPTK